jgi:aspartate aminotransferase
MSCLDPGDEMIVPEPFYTNYNSFATMAGVKVVPVPSSFENGFRSEKNNGEEFVLYDFNDPATVCRANSVIFIPFAARMLRILFGKMISSCAIICLFYYMLTKY